MNLADYIEHTALRATVTPEQVEVLAAEAVRHRFYAVCIAPRYVPLAEQCLGRSGVKIVTVVGFPLGANTSRVKAMEAKEAVAEGAHEVDMVGAIGLAAAGGWGAVEADIREVRQAIPGVPLKVILETGCFGAEEIARFAEAAIDAGADFVKTSTGFGPRGATVKDVQLLYGLAKGRAEVKASGGIRSAESARAMIRAGATRIGTSCGVDLLAPGSP